MKVTKNMLSILLLKLAKWVIGSCSYFVSTSCRVKFKSIQTRHRKIIRLLNNSLNIYILNKSYIKYLHIVIHTYAHTYIIYRYYKIYISTKILHTLLRF